MKTTDLTSKFKISLDNWCNYYYLDSAKLNAFRKEINAPTTIEKINSLFQNKNENIISLIQFPTEKIAYISSNSEQIQIANIKCTTTAPKILNTDLTKAYSLGVFHPKQIFTIPEDLRGIQVNLWCPYAGFLKLDVEKIINYNICELFYVINLNDGSAVVFLVGYTNYETKEFNILYQTEAQVGRSVSFGGRNTEKELKALKGIIGSSLAMITGGLSNNMGLIAGGAGGFALSSLNYAKTDFNKNISTQKYNDVNAPQIAYLSIIRQKINTELYKSDIFKNTRGYATNILKTLSTLTGFTQCSSFNLTNIKTATKQELDEIETYLKNGIIL